MPVRHHTIPARMLRPGHLLYTGGSGNYVLVATATRNRADQIEVTTFNGDVADTSKVIYRLDPDSEVSLSAMVPLPAQLAATDWEILLSLLGDLAEQLADGIECVMCEKNPPFCEDHQDDARRAVEQSRIAALVRAQIGRQQPGHGPQPAITC